MDSGQDDSLLGHNLPAESKACLIHRLGTYQRLREVNTHCQLVRCYCTKSAIIQITRPVRPSTYIGIAKQLGIPIFRKIGILQYPSRKNNLQVQNSLRNKFTLEIEHESPRLPVDWNKHWPLMEPSTPLVKHKSVSYKMTSIPPMSRYPFAFLTVATPGTFRTHCQRNQSINIIQGS